jgi:hypothetical protein
LATIEATFVQGNTAPDIVAQLHDEKVKTLVLNLTTATSVRFQMRKSDDTLFTVDAVADITNASQGLVSYGWADTDLNVDGEYETQWEVHWGDGKVQTVAKTNRILVRRR